MKLFEFSALVRVHIVVAANSKKEGRKNLEHLGPEGWVKVGDLVEVTDILLEDVREPDSDNCKLKDEAHIVAK